jgi:hypothetical protein
MSEKTLHRAICDYIRLQYPGVVFRSDAAGVRLTIGQARSMKRTQSNRGLPDLAIYEPRNGYHGLFIELKAEGNPAYRKDGALVADTHIQEQAQVLEKLRKKGYVAAFACGFEQAKTIIDKYLTE